ncbi:PREDICTED: growth arrest-specific protein 1 [Nanorana parkeri]|uniref:growth arrest-specific protein 1 n=1 Tax=Nanorana parkeri TaxID=125878 RepID=UPI000854E9F7|nr:PREDICTED: growth arrest-specific protein 1 [Nanorana parkeri]
MAGRRVVCTLLLASLFALALSRRLICWQAILQCQRESDCSYAYSQYTEACSSALPRPGEAPSSHSTGRRRCPSHCISALIQLNYTKGGPALEDCDCAMDELCKATKRAIEPCMPRTSGGASAGGGGGAAGGGGAVMGCMEARRLCESDRRCHSSLSRYLTKCGRLFNGVRCTDECRGVIEDMMQVPKALLLNDCVCDGLERPICESIKENMARLCFGADMGNVGPGSSGGSDYDYDDEEYDDELHQGREGSQEEDMNRVISDTTGGSAATSASLLGILGTSMVLLVLLG